jgi:hypothetical protein
MNNSQEIFFELKKFDINFIKNFTGDTGSLLYNFILNSDLNHSDLNSLATNDHKCFLELLKLLKFAYDNNLNLSLDFLSEKIKNTNFKFESTSIPNFSQKNARFSIKKNEIRLSKKKWKFCSKNFVEKIFKIWNDVPSDISLFKNKNYLNEISSLRNKESRCEKIRCQELADSIRSVMEILSAKDYHGYKPISLIVAACILAKINKINRHDMKYSPVIYPFFEFENISNLSVREEIQKAENFEHSRFDHYLIFIPSFLNHEKQDDFNILQDKNYVSFVLGEKDGFCYFICEWSKL